MRKLKTGCGLILPDHRFEGGLKIRHRTGNEGPSYDPYHWDEMTITRGRYWVTIRLGLVSWVKCGLKSHDKPLTYIREPEGEDLNEQCMIYLGLTHREILDAEQRLLEHRYKVNPDWDVDPYAGYY